MSQTPVYCNRGCHSEPVEAITVLRCASCGRVIARCAGCEARYCTSARNTMQGHLDNHRFDRRLAKRVLPTDHWWWRQWD